MHQPGRAMHKRELAKPGFGSPMRKCSISLAVSRNRFEDWFDELTVADKATCAQHHSFAGGHAAGDHSRTVARDAGGQFACSYSAVDDDLRRLMGVGSYDRRKWNCDGFLSGDFNLATCKAAALQVR